MDDELKTCTRCGESKPLAEFGSNGRGGLRSQCRACTNEAQQTRRERARTNERRYRECHPERVRDDTRERVRRWRAANPERAREQTQRAMQRYRQRQKVQ